ncbi:MAG: hypothetical protein HUJ26_06095 [Planctomycetaceae bacterium]|nr:hypothetical protein [Planctomycetaceae bacterium]
MSHSTVAPGRHWLAGVLALGFLVSSIAPLSAQDNRQLLDKLLKEYIQSELEKMDQKTNPASGGTTPTATKQVVDNSREIHNDLQEFTRDTDDLALSLSADSRRIDGLNQILPSLYQLRARSSILAEKTQTGNQWSNLLEDIKTIDRDWRTVSFKLDQLQGLTQQQTRLASRLDQISADLIQHLDARPQMNTYELTRTLASLSVDFENLLEEIDLEISNAGDRRDLLLEGRKAQQQVQHISLLIRDEAQYDTIKSEYQRFKGIWDPMLTKLQTYDNRYIERSLRRINESDRSIHELLWMPHEIDRQQLVYQTSLLKKDVDEFFARTPLKLLITLPNPEFVLSTADAFYGVCENFTDIVNRNGSREDMVDAFRYIEESQAEFITMFKPIRSQAALNVLNSIDKHVQDLRGGLVLEEQFDRRKAIELGASLQNLSEHLHMDTKLWLSHVQVSYEQQAEDATARFSQLAARFHQQALNGSNAKQLQTISDDLYEQWRSVHSYISRSTNEDRAHLARLAAHIGPTLVEVRTLTQDAGNGPLAAGGFNRN